VIFSASAAGSSAKSNEPGLSTSREIGANPTALIQSAVLMLAHIGEREASQKLQKAIHTVYAEGKCLTGDVGGPAAGEIARDNIRRQRETGAHEFLRYNGGRQRLAVDEHAVAIENDHGAPAASAGRSGPHANNQQCGRITDGKDREQGGAGNDRPRDSVLLHMAETNSGDNARKDWQIRF